MTVEPELLTIDHFESYFDALWNDGASGGDPLHRVVPFRWQVNLLGQLDEQRRWPELVDLPTGAGKTSLIDLAIFLLAIDGFREPLDRWMPRRIAMVVDRRVIVDQADERAHAIVRRLEAATSGILARVSEGLRLLSYDGELGPPLASTVLRGGIIRDESWAHRPDVPAVISSTVDQVGSRLLFRGYGVSSGMRPIHAGLLGNDVLFLLDEVHLARPFAETLRSLGLHRSRTSGAGGWMPDRWQVVELSATPARPTSDRFPDPSARPHPVADDDHPLLRRRIDASKVANLAEVRVGKDQTRANQQFADRCAAEATALLGGKAHTVGVIVNRVDTARRVAQALATSKGGPEIALLTGRMRSLDRDRQLSRYGYRLRTGRVPRSAGRPLVVVATQSIEAGADFDFDGIVTECASLDALRQRFGRVDRNGELAGAGTPTRSAVLVRSTDAAGTDPDPVYGHALRNTWSWLTSQGDAIDFGIAAFDGPANQDPLLPDPDHAPRLLPQHLDQWVQTSQRASTTEADVGRWLHGIHAGSDLADVQVIWRHDLDASLFDASNQDLLPPDRLRQLLADRVAACPPISSESMAVPIHAFRRWLQQGEADPTLADASASAAPATEAADTPRREDLWVFRIAADGGDLISPNRVRPGDTVLVPSTHGGVDQANWDPSSEDPVADLTLEAQVRQHKRPMIRLTKALFNELIESADQGDDEDPPPFPDPDELEVRSSAEQRELVRDVLGWLAKHLPSGALHQVVMEEFSAAPSRDLTIRGLVDHVAAGVVSNSFVIGCRNVGTFTEQSDGPGERIWTRSPDPAERSVADDDGRDAPSFTGRVAPLREHLIGVGALAEQFASALGLPTDMVDAMQRAGALHDAGKVDPRFQLMLHGGDTIAAERYDGLMLAKSPVPDTDRRNRQRARQESGYPLGARHELLSLSLIEGADDVLSGAGDPELVRYLVSSHHGNGRYRFDPTEDDQSLAVEIEIDGHLLAGTTNDVPIRLDQGVPDTFWRLTERYGWYGLAWLEAILRLADHERSRREQDERAQADDTANTEGSHR